MSRAVTRFVVAGALAAAVVSVPAMANAQTMAGRDFGRHVATCAQTMGLSGTHNPGMHQGITGWEPMHGSCHASS